MLDGLGRPLRSFMSLTSCALWVFLCPFSGLAQDGGQKVLARVGAETITEADLEHVLRSMRVRGQFAQALKTHTEEGKKEILSKMIETLLLYQKAEKDGFLDTQSMKRNLRWNTAQLVAEEYAKEKLFAKKPSRQEMHEFYQGHAELFKVPPEVRVRHIVVKQDEEAEAIVRELKGGRSFELLAKQHNIDGTGKREGLIGWIKPGMMVEPFDTAAFSLHKGETSGIVQTRFGFHILKIEDRREGSVRPFEKVEKEVLKAMREEQLKTFKQELSSTIQVEVFE